MARARRELDGEWDIHISPWVLLDGLYRQFEEGQRAEFAVEVRPSDGVQLDAGGRRLSDRREDGSYELAADVIAVRDDAWALDFGIRGYVEGPAPVEVMLGSTVNVTATLGVDPFHYVDHLATLETFPEMIYAWDVISIEREIAPLVAGAQGRRPDRTRSVVRSVGRTSLEVGSSEWVDFRMRCRLVGGVRRQRSL